jgi:CRISPR-associated endonuclease/helicase Cas3
LTPAFGDLLRQVASVQREADEPRPIRVMELSATLRGGAAPVFTLEREDNQDAVVQRRLDAVKHLRLHPIAANPGEKPGHAHKRAFQKLADLALKHRDARAKVLIYVRSPQDADTVIDVLSMQLGKPAAESIVLLTGTIRGYERDRLVRESSVYRAFLDPDLGVDGTVYLVSTSAAEVGIDIDADHLVCDVNTLDSMIQRLGRVNRRGTHGRQASVDVVAAAGQDKKGGPSEIDKAIDATRALLNEWAAMSRGTIDVSPRSLRRLISGIDRERREEAFAPTPPVPPLTDILLDAWSLTTINGQMPGRPEVAAYLHGLTNDPPETYVVWREEVGLLDQSGVDEDTVADWFQACRIESRERLRDRTDRVKKTLGDLLKRRRRNGEHCDCPVVVLDERGEAKWSSLSQIAGEEFSLAYRTIVLPVEAGGLSEHGMLNSKATTVLDVGDDQKTGERRERWIYVEGRDGPRYERVVTREAGEHPPAGLRERERIVLKQPSEDAEDERGATYLILLAEPRQAALDSAETARTEQTLTFHLDRIAQEMNRMSEALHLPPELKEALELAARWHDRGKDRPVWQWYACNPDPQTPLAKSMKYRSGRALGGYRHEFGSLLEALQDEQIRAHPEADLILQLIAAHHGWGRPHFEQNAWDGARTTADNEEVAAEAMRRFGRLQQRFGRWGLAWLEALVRCADIAASIRRPSRRPQPRALESSV